MSAAGNPRRRFGMSALWYGAMDPIHGPGLAPPADVPVPHPDLDAEPSGFLVEVEPAVRLHFLDWDGQPAAGPVPAARPDAGQGPSRPGVLLIHGLLMTAHAWAPVARRLRGVAHVAAMDLRGHGLSDAPVGGYDPDRLAEDAIAVAEGAGLLGFGVEQGGAGPLVVAGIGYGAIVAAWTARALGDRCAGLALVDGGWEDVAATSGATPDEWLAEIEEPPEVLESMAAWLADRAAFDPATWDADQERSARAQVIETAAGRVKIAVHPHALRASLEAMWAYVPAAVLPDVEARIAALVAGDDGGTRVAALRVVAALRASAGRSPILGAAFPGTGHNLLRHEPRAVAGVVLAAAS